MRDIHCFALALTLLVPHPSYAQPPHTERTFCSLAAAARYEIPPITVLAVASNEGGKAGQWTNPRNGEHDVGTMQWNTRTLAGIKKRYNVDIDADDVAKPGCYPYALAAWRIRKHIKGSGSDPWSKVANYHSKSSKRNRIYRRRLLKQAAKWERWLDARDIRTPAKWRVSTRLRGEGSEVKKPLGSAPLSQTKTRSNGKRTGRLLNLVSNMTPVSTTRPAATETLMALVNGSNKTTRRVRSTASTSNPSESIGSAHHGRLRNAVQAKPHPAYQIRNASRSWCTTETMQWLSEAFSATTSSRTPRVRLHDLSMPTGGVMRGHRSHQSGRDADIMYYRHDCEKLCPLGRVTPQLLDSGQQWKLLHHWIKRDQAEFIFIDYKLQGSLFGAAKIAGASPEQLAAWFQFPRGPHHGGGIVRHVPNHADHFHVRFACADDDTGCRADRDRHPESGTSTTLQTASWMELLKREAESN